MAKFQVEKMDQSLQLHLAKVTHIQDREAHTETPMGPLQAKILSRLVCVWCVVCRC